MGFHEEFPTKGCQERHGYEFLVIFQRTIAVKSDSRVPDRPKSQVFAQGVGQNGETVFMENRNGIVMDILVNEANGTAERSAALVMIVRTALGGRRTTLGGHAGCDTEDLVRDCREHNITPHFPRRMHSTPDSRTTNHVGYEISRYKRMQTKKIFGWGKTIGGLRKTRFKGLARNQMYVEVSGAAYNLLRMAKLNRGGVCEVQIHSGDPHDWLLSGKWGSPGGLPQKKFKFFSSLLGPDGLK